MARPDDHYDHGDKDDDMINVQIRSFKDSINEAGVAAGTAQQDDSDRHREGYQMQAYASPVRYPLSGTTGAAESDSKT